MSFMRAHRPSAPREGVIRRTLASLITMALIVVGLVSLPTAAIAASNADVVVSGLTLERADGNVGAPIKIGDTLLLKGTWDASDANPQPGDTFTIGLPKELTFPTAVPFPLAGADGNGDPQTWAMCLTEPATGIATCEFTAAVVANPEDVRGTFGVEIKTALETTERELTFDLNGKAGVVALPGGGGIIDPTPLPSDWKKTGSLNADKWSMTWKIELPGARLAGHDVVKIADTLTGNHVLCDPSELKIQAVRGSTETDVTSIGSIAPGADPSRFVIELAKPQSGYDTKATYVVSYRTCTPKGEIDPKGTQYGNEATVDVWGESSGTIGVTQNWTIPAKVQKQGSIAGEAHRNGSINWTVTVGGDDLVGKSAFTFTDQLSGAHALCTDTLSSLQVSERYGPGGGLEDITEQLTLTPVASAAQSFEVRIATRGTFHFQPADHMYLFRYTTCSTTDGLPPAGTTFTNVAGIDGKLSDPASTKVPPRGAAKSGAINTAGKTLDGVSHLPQTTMDWRIEIPGERVHGLGSDLTLTDTLSDSHQVCTSGEPSGGMAARLGLRVQAQDQITKGGLKTVDLTDRVTVVQSGNALKISIPSIDLPIPGGTSAGFSREYRYVLTYTTCTSSGGMDAKGTEYSNAIVGNGISFESRIVQSNTAFGSGQGMPRGTVAVSKTLTDTPGAKLVPAGTEFSVRAEEIAPDGTSQGVYTLKLPLDGAPVSGFTSRGKGWTIKLSEPTFPSVPGVSWGKPLFIASPGLTPSADGTTAVAALVPNSNVAVTLKNEAKLSSASVTKVLTGEKKAMELVPGDRAYAVTATIDTKSLGGAVAPQPSRTLTITAGQSLVLENLPVGAVVTFSEARPVDDDLLSWKAPVVSPAQVTVGADGQTPPVTITNHVSRTVGTFSLVKKVTGEQAQNPAVPDTVTVTASWIQDGTRASKQLRVPTDGSPVPFGEKLLIGTEVTLTETPLVDGSSIAWGAPVWSGPGVSTKGADAVVRIGRDAAAQVVLENHAATSTAGISLLKALAGEAAGEVPADTTFPVTASWTDAAGKAQSTRLNISAHTPTPLGVDLPAGTVVTLTEGTSPAFDTVVWRSVTISGTGVTDSGDGSATVVVSDQQDDVTLITVTNEATWAPGTFTLSKNVDGVLLDNADAPDEVTVTASWVEGDERVSADILLPTDGTPVSFGRDLPHGTEVLLSEALPAAGAAFDWSMPEWSGDAIVVHDDGTASLRIAAAVDAKVDVTNRAIPRLGTLTIAKTLAGTGAALMQNAEFPVTATWTDLLGERQEVALQVTAGAPAVLTDLPIGTEVTLVEGTADAPANVRWQGATWSTEDESVTLGDADGEAITIVVTGENGAEAAVSLENEFEKLPDLATTGGPLLSVGLVVLAAVLVGAGFLLVRRRRTV